MNDYDYIMNQSYAGGPNDVAIPMSQYNPSYRDNSFRNDQPQRPVQRSASDGDSHRRAWASMESSRETADLLESLPSRQLESLAISSKSTIRHRRLKSFHGSVGHARGATAMEEISRQFTDNNDLMGGPRDEVDTAIREMPTTLSSKREIRRRVSSKRHHRLGWCQQMAYNCGMSWQHFKYNLKELTYSLELWKSHLIKIEGHFGTGVLSYFLFLKWLFIINIPIFSLTLGFVVIPQVLYRWYQAQPGGYPDTNITFTGIELLTGAGWFENTELYYGFYTNETVQVSSGHQYHMIYAYLFTCGGYYLLCLIILAQSILKSYRKYYIEGGGDIHMYVVRRALVGWDYGITSQESANLKKKSLYIELQEYLAGKKEKTKKTMEERCQIWLIRVMTNLFILGLLGGSAYLIFYISESQSLKNTITGLTEMAMPLCVSGINLVLPFIFSLLEKAEKYELPKHELYMHLLRTMVLRMVNLGVLIYFWFNRAPKDKSCWETFMGQEIYRLVIVDFLITLLVTLFIEFFRRLAAQYCCPQKLSPPEFAIGRNTLDLIYTQALCWLGTFYSPLLSLIMIVKLIIIFYVKRISVLQNCKPSIRPWRAARSHTIFLGFLFAFFLLGTAAVACGIIFIHPSQYCGPYKNFNTTYQVVIDLVDQWELQHRGLAEAIDFISSPGVIAAICVFLCMGTYYMRIAMVSHQEMVKQLEHQLRLEGQDKRFLLGLLQEVNKKYRGKRATQTPHTRPLTNASSEQDFTSPGGRAFIRKVAEASAAGHH